MEFSPVRRARPPLDVRLWNEESARHFIEHADTEEMRVMLQGVIDLAVEKREHPDRFDEHGGRL